MFSYFHFFAWNGDVISVADGFFFTSFGIFTERQIITLIVV